MLWHLETYLEQMGTCLCMYYARIMFMQHIVHAEAACALCTLTDTTGHMIHEETFLSFSIHKHSVSLHPLRHLRMLLALFQAMQDVKDVVECRRMPV